jgi:hypothetical protein
MKNTSCPDCSRKFSINDNRAFKPRDVFDGFAQLTTYDIVICPFCKKSFQSPDAKLFGYFKSPLAVMGLTILIVVLLLIYVLFIKGGILYY